MANKGRAQNGRYTPQPDTVERDAEAARLRARGIGWQAIADQLGYGNPGTAYKAAQRALKRIVQEPAEELRQIELMRLDDMYQHALAVLERLHVAVSMGKVVRHRVPVPVLDKDGFQVTDPGTGEPMTKLATVEVYDDGPALAALDRMLRIQERRARLLGLDAPIKKRVEVVTEDQLTAELERLSQQIASQEQRVAQRHAAN